jgi:type VI secretion system protein ImpA
MNTDLLQKINDLLSPIPQEPPCGGSLRYDPIYTDIRLAREEDDPNLPMRQWERPLKKADWAFIETQCVQALTQKSKDLQLVAWLTEAWMRLYGLHGLASGLKLMHDLTLAFWGDIHPQITDGDAEARKAPFEWLSESLAVSLKIHVVMMTILERSPSRITLVEWDRLTAEDVHAQDILQPKKDNSSSETQLEPISRSELMSLAQSPLHADSLLLQSSQVRECIQIVENLKKFLDEKLAMDAPNLSKLMACLTAFDRTFSALTATLIKNRLSNTSPLAAQAATLPAEGLPTMQEQGESHLESSPVVQTGQWRTREEAYATLEAVANYLQHREPHSPTPYLIQKAVRWGRLPLPELMKEIMREEGDLNRMSNLFGHGDPNSGMDP